MAEQPDGEYVLFSDYAALLTQQMDDEIGTKRIEVQRDKLRARIAALEAEVQSLKAQIKRLEDDLQSVAQNKYKTVNSATQGGREGGSVIQGGLGPDVWDREAIISANTPNRRRGKPFETLF